MIPLNFFKLDLIESIFSRDFVEYIARNARRTKEALVSVLESNSPGMKRNNIFTIFGSE